MRRRKVKICPLVLGLQMALEILRQFHIQIDEEGCGSVFAAARDWEEEQSE